MSQQSEMKKALAPGVEKCQAAIANYLRRSAPSRVAAVWVEMPERERAFWLRAIGAADAVELHRAHVGPWDALAESVQSALLAVWKRTSARARVIEAAIEARAAQ